MGKKTRLSQTKNCNWRKRMLLLLCLTSVQILNLIQPQMAGWSKLSSLAPLLFCHLPQHQHHHFFRERPHSLKIHFCWRLSKVRGNLLQQVFPRTWQNIYVWLSQSLSLFTIVLARLKLALDDEDTKHKHKITNWFKVKRSIFENIATNTIAPDIYHYCLPG